MLPYFVTEIFYSHKVFTKLTTGHVHWKARRLRNKDDVDWVWNGGNSDLVPML
jgi:hypothetical protein